MNSSLSALLRAAAIAAACVPSLASQGVVGPTLLGPSFQPAGLNPPQVPATAVLQVQLVKLSGDPAGTWTAAMTVQGLSAAFGGQGGSDLLIGRYNALSDTFVPGLGAAACNTPGNEFGAMLDARGLSIVFERDTWVERATRTTVSSSFGSSRRVDNLPANPYYDPAIGTVDGQSTLFYVLDGTIRRSLFDDATGEPLGPSIVVAEAAQPGGEPNSPTPLVDAFGEVHGLLHHEFVGADNDQYLTTDLDSGTPGLLVIDTPSWANNGGAAAGLIVTAEDQPGPYHVSGTHAVWMTGAEAAIGRPMRASLYVPPSTGGSSFSWLLLGLQYLPFQMPISGVQGALGVDPGSILAAVPVGPHVAATGEVNYTIVVPNNPSLMGARIAAQGITQTQGIFAFTNTSSLRVEARYPVRNLSIPYDGNQAALLSTVDPIDPGITVSLAANAPLPIEIVALDLAGIPMGEPTSLLPGSVAALLSPTAVSYVARMPYQPGLLAAVGVHQGKALCAPFKKGPYCHRSTDWSYQDLPKAGTLCVELQPQTDGHNTDCNPVQWEIQSKVGEAWMNDSNGSLNSATDLSDQVCVTARAGATERRVRFHCVGDQRNRCRLTISVTVVADCTKCPQGKKPRRP